MRVKKIILALIALVIIGGFIAIGITDAVKRKDQLEFQKVQLNSKTSEIKQLNLKYEKLNGDLDKASKDKETDQAELDRLNKEKEELNKQKQDLEAQLQAKLDAKSKLAQVASTAVDIATNTQTASANSGGSIERVIAAASSKYGVSYDMMIRLANCESTMGKNLRNPSPVIVNGVDYGHAEGIYQFIPSTWTRMSSQAGYGGASVYDTVANINTAAWAFANGNKSEWECQ